MHTDEVPRSVYTPKHSKLPQTVSFSGLLSYSPKTSGFSPTADHLHAPIGDLQVLRAMYGNHIVPNHQLMQRSVLGAACQHQFGFVMRAAGTYRWYNPLTHLLDSVVLAWQLAQNTVLTHSSAHVWTDFELDRTAQLLASLAVSDLNMWACLPVEWKSPAWQYCTFPEQNEAWLRTGLRFFADCDALPTTRRSFLASRGFIMLPLSFINHICNIHDLQWTEEDDTIEKLTNLSTQIMPEMTDEHKIMDCLKHRLRRLRMQSMKGEAGQEVLYCEEAA